MNKNSSRIILYCAVVLLIAGGLALLAFRGRIVVSLQAPISLPEPSTFSAAADALDVSVLRSPRLTTLVPRVKDFDFDKICFRPESVLGQTIVGASGTEIEVARPACVRGNNLPFLTNPQ